MFILIIKREREGERKRERERERGIRSIFKLRISKFGVWVKGILKYRRWVVSAHVSRMCLATPACKVLLHHLPVWRREAGRPRLT